MGNSFSERKFPPSEINFTHDSISTSFRNGKPLEDTFQDLLDGNLSVDSIDYIEVMEKHGSYYVVRGNRRLLLFQKLEKAGKIQSIWTKVYPYDEALFSRQYSSYNSGQGVRFRGSGDLEYRLDAMITAWERKKEKEEENNQFYARLAIGAAAVVGGLFMAAANAK